MDGTDAGIAGGDALRLLDERIDALIVRVRELASARDALLAENETLRGRVAAAEAASAAAAEADASWRGRARGTATALRSVIDELRAG